MKSKVLRNLMSLCLLVVGIGSSWGADKGWLHNGLKYEVTYSYSRAGSVLTGYTYSASGTAVVTGYTGSAISLEIPSVIEGFETDADRNYGNKSLSINVNVVGISADVFKNCTSLQSVSIPNTLTTIGADAFRNCTGLTSLSIPSSVTSIGDGAFAGVKGVQLDGTNSKYVMEDYVLYGTTSNRGVTSKTSILYCDPVKNGSITIPSTVTTIGTDAFMGCTNITTLSYEEGSTSIIATGIKSITAVNLPKSATSIAASAFEGCTSLLSVDIPSNVNSIGNNAFKDCSNLTSVTIGNVKFVAGTWTTAEHYEFTMGTDVFSGCSSLTEINVLWPTLPTNVAAGAFATGTSTTVYCPLSRSSAYSKLTGVTVMEKAHTRQLYFTDNPEAAKSIMQQFVEIIPIFGGLFSQNKSTQEILHDNLTTGLFDRNGDPNLFGDCTVIDEFKLSTGGEKYYYIFTFDDDLTTIGSAAFQKCYYMHDLVIPSTVTNIDPNAFNSCSGLVNLNSSDRVNSNGGNFTTGEVVNIPEGVTTIGKDAFLNSVSIKSVNVPASVTTISDEAFMDSKSLTSVTLNSGLTTIGKDAFKGTAITSVTVPVTTTTIGATAFPATVTEVTFAEGRAEGAPIEFDKGVFVSPANIQSVTLTSGVTLSDESEFVGFNALNTVVLPSDLTTIPATTFKNCSNLATCEIPSSVTTIGTEAFAGTKLASVSVPASVTTMGDGAFKGCASLTEVTLPEGMTTIPAETFMNCSSLTEVTIPSTVTTIGKDAFAGTNITKIVIPASVTSIEGTFPASVTEVVFEGVREDNIIFDKDIFADPSKITSVSLASGVKLNEGAFDGFTALEQVTLPGDLTTIYDNMFKGCETLKEVNIPSVETIGVSAFEGCTSLTSIDLPENLEIISATSFKGCSNLETCNIPEKVSYIGVEAFAGTKLTSVTIPASVDEIAAGAFPSTVSSLTFEDRTAEDGQLILAAATTDPVAPGAFTNPDLTSVTVGNGVVLSDAALGSTQVSSVTISNNMRDVAESPLAGLSNLSTVIISNAKDGEGNSVVTSIGANVFNGIESLTSVNLNDGLESIGEGAFAGTGLTSVDLTNVSNVGAGAFAETKLESVSIPSGITLGEGVFAGTTTLASAALAEGMTTIPASTFEGCSALASANIPSTVETIGTDAFAGTGLTSVTIPASVDNIEAGAFSGSLTSVVIADQSDEGGLTIADGAFAGNEGLTTVTIGNGVTLKDATFGGTAEIPAPVNTIIISTNMADVETSPIVGLNSVETVTISEGVTSIGDNVFKGCDDLTSVNIPNTVTSMGASAFEGCAGLTTVDLSDNMTAISAATFKGCSNLTTCDIPEKVETIGFEAFAGTQLASVNIPTSVDEIKASAFPSTVTSLTFEDQPAGALIIADGAFAGGVALESVTIGNGVTLTDATFSNNSSISEVVIASNMNNVDASPIVGLDGVEIITISDGVTSIGNNVFKDCEDLTSINFNDDITTIGNNAFAGTGLASVVVPNTVTELGEGTFAGCESLESAVLPTNAGFTEIDAQMFMGCSELATCAIPDNVTTIGKEAFAGTKVNNVDLNNVTSIGESSFANNAELTSVDLANVQSIGKDAFAGTGLTNVTIPAATTAIGEDAFPATVTSVTYAGDRSNALAFDKEVFADPTTLQTVVLTSGVTLADDAFKGLTSLQSVTLPGDLAKINDGMFEDCSSLQNVVIPASVTKIGEDAFANSGLTSVDIPANVRTIGAGAFTGTALTSVAIPDNVQTIGAGAFEDCASLTSAALPSGLTEISAATFKNAENLTECEIPASVTTIGAEAFAGTKVNNVVLPASVDVIGESAFANNASLTNITLNEGLETIGDYAFAGTGLTEVSVPGSVAKIGAGVFPDGIQDINLASIPEVAGSLPTETISLALNDNSVVSVGTSMSQLKSLTYSRTVKNSWGTLYLPFAIELDEESDIQLCTLKEADFDNAVLKFDIVDQLDANVPCVFKAKTAGALVFVGKDKEVDPKDTEGVETDVDNVGTWTLKGTFEKIKLDCAETGQEYYFITNNTFACAAGSSTLTMNAFRAWFEFEKAISSTSSAPVRTFTIEIYDSSTGVKTVLDEEESAAFIYDLTGVKQSSAKSGKINIVNGKKSIVK